jgi:hypothetical protein
MNITEVSRLSFENALNYQYALYAFTIATTTFHGQIILLIEYLLKLGRYWDFNAWRGYRDPYLQIMRLKH